jgi:transcriptional regulator with XRE-family HTH domain
MMPQPTREDFIRLTEIAGWSQAETARQLHVTPAAVSQIFSGKTRPRAATYNLLKLLVAKVNPKALALHERRAAPAVDAWETRALELLRTVPVAYRDWFIETLRGMLNNLPEMSRSKMKR